MLEQRNPEQAFEKAIKEGRLTAKAATMGFTPYAGEYMYMGTDRIGRDLFKNINTREYLR